MSPKISARCRTAMAIIRADYGLAGISTGRYQFALQQNATIKVVEATQTSTRIVRSRSLLYDLVFEVFGSGFGVSHFRLSLWLLHTKNGFRRFHSDTVCPKGASQTLLLGIIATPKIEKNESSMSRNQGI